MSAGTIADFHRGLADRIGPPNLVSAWAISDINVPSYVISFALTQILQDFEATMRSEHCIKSGADVEFLASRPLFNLLSMYAKNMTRIFHATTTLPHLLARSGFT